MSSPIPKRTLACIRCYERRIKCNRLAPCTACVKISANCEYRTRKARLTRSGRQLLPKQDDSGRSQASIVKSNPTVVDLTVARPRATLENVVSAIEIEDGNSSKAQSIAVPRNEVLAIKSKDGQPAQAQITVFEPQLLQSQEGTKLIDNNLWSRIAEEVSSEADEATVQLTGVDTSRKNAQEDFSYVLDAGYSPDISLHHPTPIQVRLLWRMFVERVDPMVKILHIPTFQTAVEKAITALDHIPKSFEAIMFSVYSMAALSMTENECLESFGESRKTMLAIYVGATKTALLQANFMSSTSLVVLQALTLHIFSIRWSHEPRAVWSLTGLALRIAQTMGLFIDGSLLGLSPFETEMRRRLWWQLKHHDSRAAELCGQAKFQQFDLDDKTPKIPTNISDNDLSPSMTQIPVASVRPTEMLWGLLIADLSSFASAHKRKLKEQQTPDGSVLRSEEYSALDDISSKDALSEEIEELVETKYLRFCDPLKSLQLLALIGSRCATDFIRFIAHHPRRWTQQSHVPLEERQTVWRLCIQILDRVIMMQTMSRLQQFSWIVPYFIQWSVIIHILDTLRTEPLHQDADKAWTLVDTMYELNADILIGTNRPMYLAVGSLCLKAHSARTDATRSSGVDRMVPGYMIELQRHYHKAKGNGNRSRHLPVKEASATSHLVSNNDEETTDLSSVSNSIIGGDDNFWLEFSGGTDMTDFDFDMHGFMAENNETDTSKDLAWDWTQWDTLTSVGKPF